MEIFLKISRGISRILLYIGYGALLGLLGLTVQDVFRRYIFQNPMMGSSEWSQMLLIISMCTMAFACIDGRFIAVGVIVDKFPKKINFAVEILMGAIAFIFFMIVGWQLILLALSSNELYFVLRTPRWPLYAILGIAFFGAALATIVYVIERIRNYTPPHEKTIFDENPDLAILALSDEENNAEGGVE